jgi:hypothetical protein
VTFSYESFRSIIQEARGNGYSFLRFDRSASASGREFYLRHDVDISPNCALRLGEIAAEEGVASNIFFQLNAETYNPFSQELLLSIRRLRELGHCVGLHVDENLIGADQQRVMHSLEWFNACCEPIDMAVSFHRPTPAVLGVDFEGFVSGYGSRVWGQDRYLSDSRRSSDFYQRLMLWLTEGRTPIQLLLHPEWWHPHESVEAIWEDLRGRRMHELAGYMVTNFPKVFSPVIPAVSRDRCI